jgi:hypothetical protein
MNNLRTLRTRLDNRRRRAAGRGLFRTASDAGTGIYGSEGSWPSSSLLDCFGPRGGSYRGGRGEGQGTAISAGHATDGRAISVCH